MEKTPENVVVKTFAKAGNLFSGGQFVRVHVRGQINSSIFSSVVWFFF